MRTERTSRLPLFYTHVIGSLPRPQAVRDLLAQRAEMRPSGSRLRSTTWCASRSASRNRRALTS